MRKKFLFTIFIIFFLLGLYFGYLALKKSPKKDPYHILCMGDSITESNYGNYTQHLENLFKRNGFNIRISSRAKPGNNSGEYLLYLRKMKFLKKINPDITIIMLGTNDVRVDGDHTTIQQFKINMQEIIHIVKNHRNQNGSRIRIFIATIPPIFKIDLRSFNHTSKERINKEINPVIKQLARKEKLKLLNIHAFFSNKPELLPGIHPSKRGYVSIAKFIFEKIRPYIKRMNNGVKK